MTERQGEREQRTLIIDEFGELQRQIDLFAPTVARERILRRIIESWYAAEDPERGAELDGNLYRLTIGPKARKRTVDCRKLAEILGDDFWEHCEFPLRILDNLPIDVIGIVREERTGTRSVQAVLRMAAVEAELKRRNNETPFEADSRRKAAKQRGTGSARARSEVRA